MSAVSYICKDHLKPIFDDLVVLNVNCLDWKLPTEFVLKQKWKYRLFSGITPVHLCVNGETVFNDWIIRVTLILPHWVT